MRNLVVFAMIGKRSNDSCLIGIIKLVKTLITLLV